MMKKTVGMMMTVLLFAGAAMGGMLSEETGELVVSGQMWLPGAGDSDLFDLGMGAEVSYREWFRFPWGVGLNLGVAQWQVDNGSSAYKWQELSDYDGDATIILFGPALYFSVVDWDNWNLTFETGVQYAVIDSNVSVYNNSPGYEGEDDIDIDNAVIWHLGLEYEYMLSENLYLLGAAGYQVDVVSADTTYELGDLRKTDLQGFFARLGAKFLF